MTDLMERIRKDPYEFIMNHYEKVYKYTGRGVFSVLSLVIPSLILPSIPHKTARDIKSSINFLMIAQPGQGKSSIAETFAKLSYNSFPFESISDAKLYEVISQKDFVSVVVGDVFKIFSDKMLNKTMENILGDEQKISRMTKRTDSKEKKIRAVSFLAGTPNSLTSAISDGMIFRTVVYLNFQNPTEHEEIGEFICNDSFKEHEDDDEEEGIYEFYQELLRIQTDQHPDIESIKGYIVKEEYKKKLSDVWKPMTKPMNEKTKYAFFREIHSGLRYMIAHAFLNIFNREIQNRKLVIKEEDVDVAIKLMKRELQTKLEILSCNKVVSEEKMKTTNDLYAYVESLKKQKVNLKSSSINIMGSLLRER